MKAPDEPEVRVLIDALQRMLGRKPPHCNRLKAQPRSRCGRKAALPRRAKARAKDGLDMADRLEEQRAARQPTAHATRRIRLDYAYQLSEQGSAATQQHPCWTAVRLDA